MVKSSEDYISIGIVDGKMAKNDRYSSLSGNAISYLGKYGQIDYMIDDN